MGGTCSQLNKSTIVPRSYLSYQIQQSLCRRMSYYLILSLPSNKPILILKEK